MEFDASFFHFIRPWWLLLLPAAIGLWFAIQKIASQSHWADYIPAEMLTALKVDGAAQSSFMRWAILTLWLLLIIAAAGPSWNKQAVPTMQNQQALAIILDLSPSMLAEDLSPNRLTRARFKIIDILRSLQDGQVALIAYAGDAHTVSPLTDDPRTIESLLPALHPNVMPSAGSNVEAAIDLAQQLLTGAGAPNGDILLISDGVTEQASRNIADILTAGHRLSVLAVGGSEAAPVPKQGGGFLKNSNGEIVLANVDTALLNSLAIRNGGRFANLSANESDIDTLLFKDVNAEETATAQSQTNYDAWVDNGHWIVILLLPLFAWFFRKGLVYALPLFFVIPIASEANEESESDWQKIWRTPDQQASTLLEEERYEEAAETFQREDWSAIANYRKGDYEQAASRLDGATDATSIYNRGNALAMNGDLEGAIDAYNQVLEQQPDHVDAAHNKSVIEKLQQQQEQQQQEQQSNGEQQSGEGEQDQTEQQNEKNDSESQQSQTDQQQSQEGTEDKQAESGENDEDPTSSQQGDNSEEQADQQQSDAEQEPNESSTESEQDEQNKQQTNSDQESQDASNQEPEDSTTANATLEPSKDPLKDSSEQWLRTIPDDPSGLLRRKFEYQSRQRQQTKQRTTGKSVEERY